MLYRIVYKFFDTEIKNMKECFVFKPCESDNTFKLVPRCKINRGSLIEKICNEFSGRILADTRFLTVLEVDNAKISISRNGELTIREVTEEQARKLTNKIMKLV